MTQAKQEQPRRTGLGKLLFSFFVCLIVIMNLSLLIFAEEVSEVEITLNFAFGERTGTYSGTLEDGLPHGFGRFEAMNPNGDAWYYEGEFEEGHFQGKGKTVWENGTISEGIYVNDELYIGRITYTASDGGHCVYEGYFANNRANGRGRLTKIIDGITWVREGEFVDYVLQNGRIYRNGEFWGEIVDGARHYETTVTGYIIVTILILVVLILLFRILYPLIFPTRKQLNRYPLLALEGELLEESLLPRGVAIILSRILRIHSTLIKIIWHMDGGEYIMFRAEHKNNKHIHTEGLRVLIPPRCSQESRKKIGFMRVGDIGTLYYRKSKRGKLYYENFVKRVEFMFGTVTQKHTKKFILAELFGHEYIMFDTEEGEIKVVFTSDSFRLAAKRQIKVGESGKLYYSKTAVSFLGTHERIFVFERFEKS